MNNLYSSVIEVRLGINAENYDAARKLARLFVSTVKKRAKRTKVGPGVLPFKLTCSVVTLKAVEYHKKHYDANVMVVLYTVGRNYDQAHCFAGASSDRIRDEFRLQRKKYKTTLASKVKATHHIKRLLKTDSSVVIDKDNTITLR